MSTGSNLLLLGGAAVAGYFIYENYVNAALPADALPVLGAGNAPVQLPAGQSTTVGTQTLSGPGYVWYGAAEKQYYVSATAPTAAQIAASETAAAGSAASAGSGTGTGTGTGAGSGASAGVGEPPSYIFAPNTGFTTTLPTPTNLAGLWSAIQAFAAIDGNFTGSGGSLSGSPYHWIFYLTYVWPNPPAGYSGAWPPPLSSVFPSVADLTQPMTASTFWGGLGPYLTTAGLSGFLSGLGYYGMGQDGTTVFGAPCDSGWDLGCTPNPVETYGVTPLPTGGVQTDYHNLNPFVSQTSGTPSTGTNYAPWVLGGLALFGIVAMAASGGR